MERWKDTLFICSLLTVLVNGQASVSTNTDDNNLSKAFVSVSVLAGVILISVIVAKVVDYCYDRASLRDDASDISEHTRKLIRERLAMFKKPKKKKKKRKLSKKEQEKTHRRFLKMWSNKARANTVKKGKRKNDLVIKVEEADLEDQLHENGLLKKPAPHVTFEDEVSPTAKGTDMVIPVISINVPVLTPPSPKNEKTEPVKAENKDNVKTSTPTMPKKDIGGRGSPVKEVSGRSTPVAGRKAGSSTQSASTNSATPVMKPKTGSTPAKKEEKPDVPRSSSGTPTRMNGKVPGNASPTRPRTAPTPGPSATPGKIVTVKPVKSNASAIKSLATKIAAMRGFSAKSPRHPQSSRPGTGRSTAGSATTRKSGLWSDGVATNGPTGREATKDEHDDLNKKFVHFRGDSDDLLIPVSTDEKPKAEAKSFEKDKSSSSSADYEFLESDQKESLTNNAPNNKTKGTPAKK